LPSKPTPRNTSGYSAASAFFVGEVASIQGGAGATAGHLARGRLLSEGEENVLSDLVIFAVIGLCAGGAARLFYPGRQPMKILGTLVLGMVGAVLAGMLSWAIWPVVEGEIQSLALLTSFLGAALLLVFWPVWAYARSVSGHA